MARTIIIEPRDPVIFRDGRPAEASLPIRSMDWPLPSSIIGAIRTRLGRLSGFDAETVQRLKAIEHIGPVPAIRSASGWQLAFPAPADAVLFRGKRGTEIVSLRPRKEDSNPAEGTNAPARISPLFGARSEKPQRGPSFWTAAATLAWLEEGSPDGDRLGPRFRSWGSVLDWIAADKPDPKPPGLSGLARQRRIHLEIDPGTFAAKEGMLFTSEGLEFGWMDEDGRHQQGAICSQIRTEGGAWAALEPLAPLGGERRLAYWSELEVDWPEPPSQIASAQLIRLQLITPAAFTHGWKPGWLSEANRGSPPGFPDMKLELIGAAVPRAIANSGWDLTKPASEAQKPTRFLAPAGSVYFFKASEPVDARQLWLRSISDDPQDRRDGFGLVLCGGWQWQSE